MPQQQHLVDIAGAALIGLVFSAVLYGITCLQTFSYYVDHDHADRKFLRGLVAVIMLLDTVHLGLVLHAVYWYTVSTYGEEQELNYIVWSLIVQIGVAYVLAAMVQSYYAWRIYIISFRVNRWLPALIIVSALGAVASSFAFMVYTFRLPSFVIFHSKALILAPIAFGMELLADVMIMLGTVFYLRKGRQGHSPSFRSNLAISKLITYAAKTGIPINIFTILTITVFISHKKDLLYAPFFFVLVRLYSCSFMTILNSRKKVRAVIGGQHNASNGGGPVPLMDMPGARGVPGIRFVVETETDMSDDTVVSRDKPVRPHEP